MPKAKKIKRTTRHLGWKHESEIPWPLECSRCHGLIHKPEGNTSGYGLAPDSEDLFCYPCCADRDRELMYRKGRITLYLCIHRVPHNTVPLAHHRLNSYPSSINGKLGPRDTWEDEYATVQNWPGTLSFSVEAMRRGSHNWAGTRYDVWFNDDRGRHWQGVQYGDMTSLLHCRRLKE